MAHLARAPLRTVVVGGGPAGLMYAILAKQRFPKHEVVVYERNPPDATFGFGVVFSERTLGGFATAEEKLATAMRTASAEWSDIEVRVERERIRCGGHGFSAIARQTLLTLMQERALEVGAELHFEHEAAEADLEGADLVVAADGVNSAVRERHADEFGPSFQSGAARYIWFATPQPFDALTFIFVENEHGHWGAHAYPFGGGASTFIVETDTDTWHRAGLDRAGDLPPGTSDLLSMRYIEELFEDHLGGNGLLENNSKWLTFRTLRCRSWRAENIALIGDAAHTAHFSVGSGTKMAMEDAIAFADAVGAADSVSEALTRYEAAARPSVEYIQRAGAPSLIWWERFRFVTGLPLEQFSLHFLSRSPMVTRERLLRRDARYVQRVDRWAERALGPGAGRGPLGAGLDIDSLHISSRLIVAPVVGRDTLASLGGAALAGAGLVLAHWDPKTDWAPIVDWVHENTQAAVCAQLADDACEPDTESVAAAGFDILCAPVGAGALTAWPVERPILALVDAPEDIEGDGGNAALNLLRAESKGHTVVAGVIAASGSSDARVRQLMLCDRIKQETGLLCALVDATLTDDDAVTAIVSGRADLVQGLPTLVSPRWEQPSEVGVLASGRSA